MPNPSSMTLVLSADDRYARPLAVTAYSALKHLAPRWSVDVYIIERDISVGNQARIKRVLDAVPSDVNATVHWITANEKRVEGLPVLNDWISTSAYLRLCLPDLLPDSCDRVIYLDSDLLVTNSLSTLWAESFDGTALCAVQDYYTPYVASTRGLDYYKELGISAQTPYFNAGVMVINLAHWRRHNIGEQALQHIQKYRDQLNFHDQEGLNAVVAGNWKSLDPAWNVFVTPDRLKHVPPSEIRKALVQRVAPFQSAYVHHFAGEMKPWSLETYHPMQRQWYSYLWDSEWHTPSERWASIGEFVPKHLWGWCSQVLRDATRPARHWVAPRLPEGVGGMIQKQ